MSRLQEALAELRNTLANARRGPANAEEACGFCGWPRSAVPVMLTGPGGAICSVCVEHAFRTVLPGLAAGASSTEPPADQPRLITGIPLAARDGAPAPQNARSRRVAEHVRQRADQVTKLLDQVDTARGQLIEKAEALAWSIERYLESATSDKLLLALPFDDLVQVAWLLEQVASVIKQGQAEARTVGRT